MLQLSAPLMLLHRHSDFSRVSIFWIIFMPAHEYCDYFLCLWTTLSSVTVFPERVEPESAQFEFRSTLDVPCVETTDSTRERKKRLQRLQNFFWASQIQQTTHYGVDTRRAGVGRRAPGGAADVGTELFASRHVLTWHTTTERMSASRPEATSTCSAT